MASSSARASAGRASAAPATFSRRCATDEVPGISRMFGERCSSQASATAIGVRVQPGGDGVERVGLQRA